MAVLFWGLVIFVLGFIVHIAAWKIRVPKRQAKTLTVIFLAVLFIVLSAFAILKASGMDFIPYPPSGFYEYLYIILFDIVLIVAYLLTYPPVEVDSPSLVMVMKVADAGPEGLPVEELRRFLDDDILVMPRVRDLLQDKMAYMDGGRYRVTQKGATMVRIVAFYRKLINTSKGG